LVLHRPRHALDAGLALDDFAAAVKVNEAADLERIGHYLDALEAKASTASGARDDFLLSDKISDESSKLRPRACGRRFSG
jgi:hypothetical protein